MDIIFATSNEHKVKEVNQIIGKEAYKLISLKEIGFHDDIEETGTTLNENAWIKTDHIYKRCQQNVIAEDTGLEVRSLNMEPGVYSARYAGPQRDDHDNMKKLLNKLVHQDDRTAQFRTVVALILDGVKYSFEGIVTGQIALAPSGTGGFGYDPIFVPDGYSQSFGELSSETKNNISHRARAFIKVKQFLEAL